MAQVNITVCDKCGNPSMPTRHYVITSQEGASVEVDLCMRHSGPLDDLLIGVTGDPNVALNPPSSTPARRRGRKMEVTSIEEIEGRKATKKTARRPAGR